MKFLKTKYLTPIALLIFFMPFLRNCVPLTKYEATEVEAGIDSVAIDTSYVDTIKDVSNSQKDFSEFNLNNSQNESKSKKDNDFAENLNGYQLAGFLPSIIMDKEFEVKDLYFGYSFYTYIFLLSILMIVFSWRRKFLKVRNLAAVNIILLTISTFLLIKTGFIKEFTDVKYGFYIFLIYSIVIIYISNKENLKPET